jgi:hypothetical protein
MPRNGTRRTVRPQASDPSSALPVHCGQSVTLYLQFNPSLSAFQRPNLERRHPWLCVWCGAENSIGFDGEISGVVRGHEPTAGD